MKAKSLPKIQAVYDFFLKEGFQHTVEEVAEAVQVTPKTLFNRYQTKANMEYEARHYWHKLLHGRLMEKTSFCNNAVEKLVLLICEAAYCLKQENHYFMKEVEDNFSSEKNAFKTCLNQFVKEGMETGLLNKTVNMQEYANFFIHNLFSYFPQHYNADTFFQMLSPVFLPESHDIFNQININQIIHQ